MSCSISEVGPGVVLVGGFEGFWVSFSLNDDHNNDRMVTIMMLLTVIVKMVMIRTRVVMILTNITIIKALTMIIMMTNFIHSR